MFIILPQSQTASKTKLQAIRLLNRWLEPSIVYHPVPFVATGDNIEEDPYEDSIVLNHISAIVYDYAKEKHTVEDFEAFVRNLINEIEQMYP